MFSPPTKPVITNSNGKDGKNSNKNVKESFTLDRNEQPININLPPDSPFIDHLGNDYLKSLLRGKDVTNTKGKDSLNGGSPDSGNNDIVNNNANLNESGSIEGYNKGLASSTGRLIQDHLFKAKEHDEDARVMDKARRDLTINLLSQFLWFSLGSYLTVRGYRYADYTFSPAYQYTKNKFLSKLVNPLSILGGVICSVTTYQFPHDVALYKEARFLCTETRARRNAELMEIKKIYDLNDIKS